MATLTDEHGRDVVGDLPLFQDYFPNLPLSDKDTLDARVEITCKAKGSHNLYFVRLDSYDHVGTIYQSPPLIFADNVGMIWSNVTRAPCPHSPEEIRSCAAAEIAAYKGNS